MYTILIISDVQCGLDLIGALLREALDLIGTLLHEALDLIGILLHEALDLIGTLLHEALDLIIADGKLPVFDDSVEFRCWF